MSTGQTVFPTKLTYASIVSFTSISIQTSIGRSIGIQSEQSNTWSRSSVAPTKSISVVTVLNDCTSCSAIRSIASTSRFPTSQRIVLVTSTVTSKSLHMQTTTVIASKTFIQISASKTSIVVTSTPPPKSSSLTYSESTAISTSANTISKSSTSSCTSCHVSTSSVYQTSLVFQGSASHFSHLSRFAIGMSAIIVFIHLA